MLSEVSLEKQREIGHTQNKRRQCDCGGRDWSGVTTSRGMPAATRSWKRLEPLREHNPANTLIQPSETDLRLLASSPIRE